MSRRHLVNATIVLSDAVLERSSVLIEDGVVAAVDPDSVARAEIVNLRGSLLLPGLVDLHADAIEKDLEPRPNVRFPIPFALAQADRRNAAAGITTAYHAVSFAQGELGVRCVDVAAQLVEGVGSLKGRTLIDHRAHVRYEITDPVSAPVLFRLMEAGKVDLLSFMEHTPGRGQFKNPEAYRAYLMRTYQVGADEADRTIDAKRRASASAADRVAALAAVARARRITMASHDDETPGQIRAVAAMGVTLSEFPVTLEAARAARDRNMFTIFGAPNVLRGQSQSGAIRATEAVEARLACCLCSDYASAAMLPAIFRLAAHGILDLPAAVQLVTRQPALAVGLSDRGEIAVGRRADLVAVRHDGAWPAVTHCWIAGREVLRMGGEHFQELV